MTIEKLKSYYLLECEIDMLQNELDTFFYSAYANTDTKMKQRLEAVEKKIKEKINELKQTRLEIDNYILDIDEADADVRIIIYYRFIKKYTWNEVADQFKGGHDENWVKKRFSRYLKKH